MAPLMLPYLVDRPVNLHRFPNGVDQPGFWHKEVPKHAPDWLARWHYDDARPGRDRVVLRDRQPAGAGVDGQLRRRRAAPVDVDGATSPTSRRGPSSTSTRARPRRFDDIVLLARLYRTALEHLGVRGRPKVTGQRGIQIWVPIAARLLVRRDAGVGRGALARRRRHRARAGQLEVAQVRP